MKTIIAAVFVCSVALFAPVTLAGDPPSLTLSRFGGAHLDRILGPIDQNVPLPRNELMQLRGSFLDWKAKAPPNEQPAWHAAVAVCDALNSAMDEREKARASLETSSAVHGSSDLGARRKDNLRNRREWARERHEEANRKQDAAQKMRFSLARFGQIGRNARFSCVSTLFRCTLGYRNWSVRQRGNRAP